MTKKLHLLVTSLCGIYLECFECQFIVMLLQTYVLDRCCNCFLTDFICQENGIQCSALTLPFDPKRASLPTEESLFCEKVGKVTFFARKSLPCCYSALSLQAETGEIPACFHGVPPLCLHSGSTPGKESGRQEAGGSNRAEPHHNNPD